MGLSLRTHPRGLRHNTSAVQLCLSECGMRERERPAVPPGSPTKPVWGSEPEPEATPLPPLSASYKSIRPSDKLTGLGPP
jgi:hypothetical protein